VFSCRVEDVVQLRLVTSLPHACTPPEPHLTRNIFHFLGQTRLAEVQGCLPATNGTTANRRPTLLLLWARPFLPSPRRQLYSHVLSAYKLCLGSQRNTNAHFKQCIIRRHGHGRCEELQSSTGAWPTTSTVNSEAQAAHCSALELKNKGTFVSTNCVHPVSAGVSSINVNDLGLGVKVGTVLAATTGIRNLAGIAGADSRR
jgi:hypothetical protein